MNDCQPSYDDLKIELAYMKQDVDQLRYQIAELKRNRFGSRSEKFNNPMQNVLDFNETNDPIDVAGMPELEAEIPSHKRKKKSRSTKELPKRIEIIPVDEADRQCACGETRQLIRYEVSEKIDYHPATFEFVEERREVVACKKSCDNSIIMAKVPKCILPKVPVTDSLLAHIIVSKCDDRQPLNHLEQQFSSRNGVNISRQSMSRWFIKSASPLTPILNALKESIIDYNIGSLDATTLQVLKEPDRKATTKSYVYCFRGGDPGKESIIYEYNEKEHKKFVKDWFEGFSGAVHSDADSFFNGLYAREDVWPLLCNAHARRKYEAITKTSLQEGLAHEAMCFYSQLYKIERMAKAKNYSHEQIKQTRQEQSVPILVKFKAWLEQKNQLVPPKAPIAQAINYTLRHWEGLIRYCEDGRYSIDNNHTEREIKPFVIARKNFMFSASQEGARALCLHFSLIRSAKLHKLDPYRYYVEIMKKVPYCEKVEDYEALLPWNINLEKVISKD